MENINFLDHPWILTRNAQIKNLEEMLYILYDTLKMYILV